MPSSSLTSVGRQQSHSLVIVCGLASTALTLLGVYVLNATTEDFHIMGWYANYVIPAGAIIVGLAASSGYGLASWFSGIKITRSLLWSILLFQTFAYFAAQFIEFKSLGLTHQDGTPVSFFEFFDFTTRSFSWKQKDGSIGQPLGLWGYAIRGLEIVGFVAGSLIVPAVLRKAPYCQGCRRYMRTQQLALVPASVPLKKIKKSDTEGLAAHEAEQRQAFEGGQKLLDSLRQIAAEGKAPEFGVAMSELEGHKKEATKLPRRFSLRLVSCHGCNAGSIVVNIVAGQGNNIQQAEHSRFDVQPEFVTAVRGRK